VRLVSVSSHVAFGHVGNAAILLPLQRLGVEVLPIMTVQFSSHLGYPDAQGGVIPASLVGSVLQGLERQDILKASDGLISGFLGDPETPAVVARAAAAMKRANPRALFMLDPVLGDSDSGLYVKEAVVAATRSLLVPKASLMTPNLFELKALTGREPDNHGHIVAAARQLIAAGPEAILVTSAALPEESAEREEAILVTAEEAWLFATERLHFSVEPHGGGDLLAALFLIARLQGLPLPGAAQRAIAQLFHILKRTQEVDAGELLLLECQDDWMEEPPLERVTVSGL